MASYGRVAQNALAHGRVEFGNVKALAAFLVSETRRAFFCRIGRHAPIFPDL